METIIQKQYMCQICNGISNTVFALFEATESTTEDLSHLVNCPSCGNDAKTCFQFYRINEVRPYGT